jgi:hypothetical protein
MRSRAGRQSTVVCLSLLREVDSDSLQALFPIDSSFGKLRKAASPEHLIQVQFRRRRLLYQAPRDFSAGGAFASGPSKMTDAEVRKLADRIYTILVRRLATEKHLRGASGGI